jgi:uncharacterized membrane protein (UPF0136 family)
MYGTAAGAMAVYGLVSIGLGLTGYLRAGSLPSLIAGGVAGLLLWLCAFGLTRWPVTSLIAAILISLALVGRFAPKVIKEIGNLGELTGTLLGVTAVVMAVGGVVVIVFSVIALFTRGSSPPTP